MREQANPKQSNIKELPKPNSQQAQHQITKLKKILFKKQLKQIPKTAQTNLLNLCPGHEGRIMT